MTIKSILSVCFGLLMFPSINADAQVKKAKTTVTVERANTVMEQNVSELMADRVGFRKDIGMSKLSEATIKAEEARESLLFPADELYGSNWNTQWVDPYRGEKNITFPDSCVIDCSSFYYPIDSVVRITSKYGPRLAVKES